MGLLNKLRGRVLSNPVLHFFQLCVNGDFSSEDFVNGVADEHGSQHVRLFGATGQPISPATNTPVMDWQGPSFATVTAVSSQVLAANVNRNAAVLVNDSDTDIYISFRIPAVANRGIRLNSNGGVIVLSRWGSLFTTGAIFAVHASTGNKNLTVQEVL